MKQLGPHRHRSLAGPPADRRGAEMVGLGLTTSAHAQHCPIPHDAQSSLQLHDAEQQIRFIQQTLTDAAGKNSGLRARLEPDLRGAVRPEAG